MKEILNRHSYRLTIRPRTARALLSCSVTALFVFSLGLSACDRHDSTPPAAQEQQPKADSQTQAPLTTLSSAKNGKSNLRQIIMLNRLAKQDSAHVPIDRATITDQNEVGVYLSKSVETDKVPDVARAIVERIGQEFPEDDLTIVVFASSEPTRKVGTAQRNAKTKETSYTPESQ